MHSTSIRKGLFTLGLFSALSINAAEVTEPVGNFPKDEYVKVSVIAFSPPGSAPVDVPQAQVDAYKKATIAALDRQIREAAGKGARMVVTPEFSTVGYPDIPELPDEEDEFLNHGQIAPYTEALDGPTVKHFSKLAKDLDIWLIVGIAEDGGKGANDFYNTAVAINPKGQTVASYRKINLFEGEKNFLKRGNKRVFFDTEFGRVGLILCFDIHFAHPGHDLVTKDKSDIMAFPTSWVGQGGMSSFANFAGQFKVYFLAANHTYFPDSGVVAPDGVPQSHITAQSGPAYGYIKRKKKN